MATFNRLLRTSRPLRLTLPSSCLNSTSSSTLRCFNKVGEAGEKRVSGNGERKSMVSVKASVVSDAVIASASSEQQRVDLASLVAAFIDAVLKILRPSVKRKPWRLNAQKLIERAGSTNGDILVIKERDGGNFVRRFLHNCHIFYPKRGAPLREPEADVFKYQQELCFKLKYPTLLGIRDGNLVIIDCRFFTLFAVAGSVIGSILCFVEGCFIILQSYFEYFHTISQRLDQEHVLQLLIEAIDMFLVGTAMLTFGMGLYIMFVGSKNMKRENGRLLSGSNLFGLFHLQTVPTWVKMESVSEAKSKMGQAVVMILQAGVLEKFKSIPLVNGLDLACFAAAILVSSTSLFLLSRLSPGATKGER